MRNAAVKSLSYVSHYHRLASRTGRGVLTSIIPLLTEPIHPAAGHTKDQPHVTHLLAAFCMDFGYHARDILPYINSLRRAERGRRLNFHGSVGTAARPFYSNLVYRINQLLKSAQERKVFTPSQIAEALDLPVAGERRFVILGILTMHLPYSKCVEKL